MNESGSIDAVIAEASRRGLQHVHFGFFDAYGHLIAKRSNVANLKKAMSDGTNMVAAIFSAAPSGTAMISTNPLVDPERGFGDGVLRIDAASCRDFPLEADGQGLLLLGEFVNATGEYCVWRAGTTSSRVAARTSTCRCRTRPAANACSSTAPPTIG
jgi:hypothetical protein